MVDRLGPQEWLAAAAMLRGEQPPDPGVAEAVADFLVMMAAQGVRAQAADAGGPSWLDVVAARASSN